MLTIIMYHYVRDLARSHYPAIKGLDTAKFEGQLDYIADRYAVVSLAEVRAAAKGEKPLPENACLLSFDDGFIDHYKTVFPRLQRRGWTGCFFPSTVPVLEHVVLDVHKIHFILAAADEPRRLVQRVFELLGPYRKEFDLPTDEILYERLALPSRFDPAEVVFLKRVLQRELPEAVRAGIVDSLFREFVSDHGVAFAGELYMDIEQMRLMARSGMEFGGHGCKHVWLASLSREEQAAEIAGTVDFLRLLDPRFAEDWTMSYPYGNYNATTLDIVRRAGCALGLTAEAAVAKDLSRPWELPRLDTNDVPFGLSKSEFGPSRTKSH